MPYEQRVKLLEKYQSNYQKTKTSSSNEITLGSLVSLVNERKRVVNFFLFLFKNFLLKVCLKSLPLYNSGSVCFTVTNGQPKIGQISENVFSYRDNKFYSFKVRTIDRYKNK